MINIKLDKTGGLTGSAGSGREAERQEFERMLGCALHLARDRRRAPLAPLARFADLDGPTWLAVDGAGAAVQHRRASSLSLPAQQIGHRRQVTLRCLVGGDRRNSAVMQGSPISAHQLPKEPGVS